jgi:hypothetical protein
LILSYICIAFPPRQGSEENLPTIPDPWEGPEVYAEDFYSGGDVRILPGEPIDPSLLTGTGDLHDGIDAFLTPGALSASQSEHIVANEEDVDEDARAPAQHYVTASRRDQPIPADAEFISIDDSDDEQEKEQETKLQDIQPVSKEADYSEIYNYEGALQETEENVDEDQHIVVSPFGTANQGHTVAEHDDRFEQVSHGEQHVFYGEENEDNFDILPSAEAQNGLSYFITYFLKLNSSALGVISDFGDVSSSTFLSEISPSNFAIPSSARELSAVPSKQDVDVVSFKVKINDAEPSQENIHPVEVIELDVVQEEDMVDAVEATSEQRAIDLDVQVEGATISKINAAIGTLSSEDAENAFIQDQVIVNEVQNHSVSAEESAVSVEEITNIDEEVTENIPADVELVDGMYASALCRERHLLITFLRS